MGNGTKNYHRFLDGDDSALVEIIREYKDGLILYLCGIVRDVYTAEDLMTDTFLKLALKKPRFINDTATFKTWLYKVARNLALDYLRKSSNISGRPVEDYANLLIDQTDVLTFFVKEEEKRQLYLALQSLKEEYRQILYLVYFEGFDNSRAGSVMKKNKRQIENLLYRAKSALKTELEKKGFVYEGQ